MDRVFSDFNGTDNELIPVLQDIQEEIGYIPREAMSAAARFLSIPESTVYGVATFYTQFHLKPQGKNKIKLCMGTACHVRGADEIRKAIEDKLGIQAGESTADLKFSLEKVACFGSCALAPVMVVNDRVYGNMTPEHALEILDEIS